MGKTIFLHVRNNNHYVLMNGYKESMQSDSVFFVNDPYYDINYYPATEVVKGEAAIHSTIKALCNSNQNQVNSFIY